MQGLPTGTVSFLFSDLEGSTRLWESCPDEMPAALARHDELLRTAIEAHHGCVVKTTGDGVHAVFASASDAVAGALAAQRALTAEPWPTTVALKVRMGIHSGEADLRDGDYYGTAVNRAARISALAHGEQLVVSQATAALLRDRETGELELVDLGEHVLRDLSHREHIFQVWRPPLRRDFPPLRSLESYPSNLPRRATSFVGREREVRQVSEALERSPLVTLTGVGGIGKTRLSLQVAADALPRYPDGAWLCELSSANEDDALLQVVGAVIGVGVGPGDRWHGIVEALRSKRLLLLLDNCEHLIDAASELAEHIVEGCPDVTILATSREGLAVDGEQVVPLRPLAVPDADADLAEARDSDAVRLFTERVRTHQPDYQVTAADVAGVVELCRRLDGVPLAIELAAARTSAMSPAEIASLLDERFRLLTGGRRGSVERHQTLRATVDWSYSLLDPRDRTVFARLGVFAGSFTADSAAGVAAAEGLERFDVLDALTSLVNKSMVTARRDDDGATRYQLLETLRQFARERLAEDDDPDHWRRRHAEYFAADAETLGPLLVSPDEIAARRVLMADLDDMRAAVTWALDRPDPDEREAGLRIITALVIESSLRVENGMGSWAIRALPLLPELPPEHAASINTALAWMDFHQGNFESAVERAESVVNQPGPATAAIGSAYSALGTALMQLGRAEEGSERSLAAAERCRGNPNPEVRLHVSTLLSQTAMNLAMQGDGTRALAYAEEALAVARDMRSPTAIALAQAAVGRALLDDDPAAAIPALEESVVLGEAGSMDAIAVPTLWFLAIARCAVGDFEGAADPLARALRRARDSGLELMLAFLVEFAVTVLAATERHEPAAVLLGALDHDVLGSMASAFVTGLESLDSSAERIRAHFDRADLHALEARGAEMDARRVVSFCIEALSASATS
jgi:predicted ATPase/class 3 adenylate cyclase